MGCLGFVLVGLVCLLLLRLWQARPHRAADPTLGDPEAQRLLAGLKERQDWPAVHAFLEGQRDWWERAFYVGVLEGHVSAGRDGAWLDAWMREHPTSSLPHLLQGAALLQWAWEARGSGTSDTVSAEGRRLFLERLAQAETALQRAAELDPEDPTPFSFLITVTMGLQHPLDVTAAYFHEAVRRDRFHLPTHFALLYRLTEKWGGSHEAMFEYARSTVAELPDGHPLHLLLVEAHVMRFEYFAFDGDPFGRARYLRKPDVQADIEGAYARMVGSPAWVEPPHDSSANEFAFYFWRVGDNARLASELARMRHHVTDSPWELLGYHGVEIVERLRKKHGVPLPSA